MQAWAIQRVDTGPPTTSPKPKGSTGPSSLLLPFHLAPPRTGLLSARLNELFKTLIEYASYVDQGCDMIAEYVMNLPRSDNPWSKFCWPCTTLRLDAGLYHIELFPAETAQQCQYRTRDEATQDIFEYIEVFYNRLRRHSTLGYSSPAEFEARAAVA